MAEQISNYEQAEISSQIQTFVNQRFGDSIMQRLDDLGVGIPEIVYTLKRYSNGQGLTLPLTDKSQLIVDDPASDPFYVMKSEIISQLPQTYGLNKILLIQHIEFVLANLLQANLPSSEFVES